jgi:acyl-CoA thioester hydrolase
MTSVNPKPLDFPHHEIEIRVRYQETDAQGRVHHANYINFFEIGRVEFLRALGHSYRDLEDKEEIMLVVAEVSCQYFLPARYDDLLTLRTTVTRSKGVRIRHEYKVFLHDNLIAMGHTVVACVGRNGKVKKLPKWLVMKPDTD